VIQSWKLIAFGKKFAFVDSCSIFVASIAFSPEAFFAQGPCSLGKHLIGLL